MPVKMRLHRVGAKHQPSYRIIVTPALTPRDGSYLDQVGFYNPVTKPATINIDSEKAIAWLRKGVQPTDRVARLLAAVDIDPAAVRQPPATESPATTHTRRARTARTKEVTPEPATGEDSTEAVRPRRRSRAAATVAADDSTDQQSESGSVEKATEKPVRRRTTRRSSAETEATSE